MLSEIFCLLGGEKETWGCDENFSFLFSVVNFKKGNNCVVNFPSLGLGPLVYQKRKSERKLLISKYP
jgi:hypothetical protein